MPPVKNIMQVSPQELPPPPRAIADEEGSRNGTARTIWRMALVHSILAQGGPSIAGLDRAQDAVLEVEIVARPIDQLLVDAAGVDRLVDALRLAPAGGVHLLA